MERLSNLRQYSTSSINLFKHAVKSCHQMVGRGIDRLNLPQKLYLISLIFICFSERSWLVICGLIMAGLSLEFWPRFNQMWHSLLGKSCLLFFYAIIANFALASAASVINDITGVGAHHLPYSHNFAILLYLSAWLIGFTFLALLVTSLLSPLYIIFILLLKPFGVKAVKAVTQSNFPVLTTIARMFLSGVVLAQFMVSNQADFVAFSDKLNKSVEPIVMAQRSLLNELEQEQLLMPLSGENIQDQTDIEKKNNDPLINHAVNDNKLSVKDVVDTPINDEDSKVISFFGLSDNKHLSSSNRKRYHQVVLYSLNLFIFELEADSYSRCEISDGTRIVELNDFEMLEISEDKTSEFGFRYQVKPCLSVGVLTLNSKSGN